MAMEAALVSVATGVLKPVIGKLTVLLGNEYKRFKTVRKEIKSLTNELAAMEAFLLKMSEEEDPDVQDKVWMNEVRELSYDLEDAIDDFMQSIGDKDEKPDGFIEKIKSSLGKLGKMKARRRIGKEIQDLKKQIIEVGDRNARYKSREAFSKTANATVDPRALAIFEHASKLVGIDEPKAELIKLLTDDDGFVSTQQQTKIVSIVGSGGMGKTTLANQVYQELKGQYECRAFVSVSRNPNITTILRTIYSEVAKKDYASTKAGNIQQLIIDITDFLAVKRYFVIVDDIWDVHTWDVIKHSFPVTSSGSIIITTTRINDVAKSCHSSFIGDVYNIRPLNLVHSKKLFQGRLFDSKEDLPSHLENVFDEILKKCDGLPLAIIAISGLLAKRGRTEVQWNQVKDSIGRSLERNPSVEGMMKILSISYFDLPPHLKTCLLYLSIYLEDSTIEKKDLIRRWVAEGFIHREGIYTKYEMGERCFNELLNRGLIQPGMTNEHGKVKCCRVHDTILDFIISKSIEENFVTILGDPILKIRNQSKVVRRLSLQGAMERNLTGLVLSHVRSLTVFRGLAIIPSLEFRHLHVPVFRGLAIIPSLEEFRHLHVLDVSIDKSNKSYTTFEKHQLANIVRLFQLRYLNLSNTGIRELPEQIENLGCLEMLDLRFNRVNELPASIVNLRKLSHLLVSDGVKFPDGIVKMQALETLKLVNVSQQPLDFLWGLGQLKNLSNLALELHPSVVQEECKKAIISSLCKLGSHNLRSLNIRNDWRRLLHGPLCLVTLEKLSTRFSEAPQIPKWMASLRNLQQLRLEVEGVKQGDLCILGALPTLFILHLKEATMANKKLRISGEVGFQSLRIFVYEDAYTLPLYCGSYNSRPVDLMFGAGSMPKLEKLVLNCLSCVEADSLDFGIENLPCLSIVELIGKYGNAEAVKTAMKRATNTHSNHPSLLFSDFSKERWF